MDHFAGMDVSVKETSVCILDDAGKIVKEVKVASEPQALLKVLGNPTYCFKRIGLEAGPLSQWLFSALAEAELPVLKAQINKTDRNAPGVVIRRRHTSSSRTMASKRRCRMTICSRRTRRTTSSGSTRRARNPIRQWLAVTNIPKPAHRCSSTSKPSD